MHVFVMNLVVTVFAHVLEVVPPESYHRIVYVLRRELDLVVHNISELTASAHATVYHSPVCYESVPAFLPCCGLVKLLCKIFRHFLKSKSRNNALRLCVSVDKIGDMEILYTYRLPWEFLKNSPKIKFFQIAFRKYATHHTYCCLYFLYVLMSLAAMPSQSFLSMMFSRIGRTNFGGTIFCAF